MILKSFRNFKIKSKLMVLEAVTILGLLIMGSMSVFTARQINQASTDISQKWLPSVIIAEDLNTDISNYRIKEYYYVISGDQNIRRGLEDEMLLLRDKIEVGFESYVPYITDETDKAMMDKAQGYWNEYLKCSDSLLVVSRGDDHNAALNLIVGESRILFDEASRLFLDVVNFNKEGAEQASIHGDQLYRELTEIKLLTILLIAVIITCLITYISRAIEKPVEAIVEGARRVSNGDLDVYLDYRSQDEIGVLTDSVNALIKRLRDIIEDEKHLFLEIGNENFAAKSNCERAYRGDFAPILYAIESLKRRLELAKLHKEGKTEEVKNLNKGKIERINVRREVDVTDKKS